MPGLLCCRKNSTCYSFKFATTVRVNLVCSYTDWLYRKLNIRSLFFFFFKVIVIVHLTICAQVKRVIRIWRIKSSNNFCNQILNHSHHILDQFLILVLIPINILILVFGKYNAIRKLQFQRNTINFHANLNDKYENVKQLKGEIRESKVLLCFQV